MLSIKRGIPHALTTGNLVGGLLAIAFALEGPIEWVPYCIFGAVLCDFLDGFVARFLGVSSEWGKQLDSLADMVTFGVAPGFLVYRLVRMADGESLAAYLGFALPIAALFRLAKFNLDARQATVFTGVPTPAVALFFAPLPLMIREGQIRASGWKWEWSTALLSYPWAMGCAALLLAVAMVAKWRLFSLKMTHFKWRQNEVRYLLLILSGGGLLSLQLWALPLIVLLYLILSGVHSFIKKLT